VYDTGLYKEIVEKNISFILSDTIFFGMPIAERGIIISIVTPLEKFVNGSQFDFKSHF
jgi:hypothetical protein